MNTKNIRSGAVAVALAALAMLGCENDTNPTMPDPTAQPAAAQAPATTAESAPETAANSMPEPENTTDASLLGPTAWVTLFAGHDLASFDTLGNAQWNIVDDYIEADGGMASFLVTKGQYGDFLLRVEFWPSADANSGVFIRCQNRMEVNAESCYEINIFDQNENADNRTGAIIGHSAPMASIETGDRWNTYEIRAEGPHIVVTLNDTVVADIENDEFAAGAIALQNNGGLIRLRNVQIRPL
jgi:hypothetical protein